MKNFMAKLEIFVITKWALRVQNEPLSFQNITGEVRKCVKKG